jgi:hypothetical protein
MVVGRRSGTCIQPTDALSGTQTSRNEQQRERGATMFLLTHLRSIGRLGLVCAVVFLCSTVYAGNFVTGGTVINVTNSRSGGDPPFVISTSGGTGPCSVNQWIAFYPTDFSDQESFKRAFAQVLLAFTTGAKVTIGNPSIANPSVSNGDCWHANYIELNQ